MAASNVVGLNSETLYYIPEIGGGKVVGVGDKDGMIEFISNDKTGALDVYVDGRGDMSKEQFRRLCVAWLALNYPDTLKFYDV